jgi:hypothetical protein
MAINEKDPRVVAMRKMKYSDAQIEEMLEDDKATDKGVIHEWDLSPEDHKKAMKYANVDEHKKSAKKAAEPSAEPKKAPTVYNWNTEGKKPKANPTKEQIISAVAQFLTEHGEIGCENVEITNKQGKISFTMGENSFSFSLTQHRKK